MGIEVGMEWKLPKEQQTMRSIREEETSDKRKTFAEIMAERPKVPYAAMVKDGILAYNGVIFVADEKTNSLNLGDCSHQKDCISISLADGGTLNVNRENIGELAACMDMFSPEDQERILRAIQTDIHIARKNQELEELEDSIGSL